MAPAVTGTSDSNLVGLTVTGDSLTPVAPSFDPATHDYQVVGNDNTPATVTPVLAPNTTAVVTGGATTYPLTAGVATVPLTRGRNDITVTVTSSNGLATSAYRVTAWRLSAPASKIVALADAHSTVFGGTKMTVTLANGLLPGIYCARNARVGGRYSYIQSTTFDPTSGLTKLSLAIPAAANRAPGAADLVVTNYCFPPGGGYVQAVTTSVDAVTYTAGYHITSADIPATVTSGTSIVLHGPDVGAYADVAYWMTDAQGNDMAVDWWDFTANGSTTIYPDYPTDSHGPEAWYEGSGPRTLHVGYCPIGVRYWRDDLSTCTSLFARGINWVAPTPTQLSFSPTSGPMTGGTIIRLRGRFISSGTDHTTITVGGQTVSSWNNINQADDTEGTYAEYTQGQDVIEFPAPASTTTGRVAITVTNDMGATTAAGTFTYSARPAITSIVPASVANSGGSVITVTGTAFGTSGRPSVIINGVKSPSVTLVSATQLTAVVPASPGTTGPVDVSVSSPQGGGISSAASLNLVAPTILPTVTEISPAFGQVGDDVTLTGAGFGALGTAGVSIDGRWALVTASSSTGLTFEVPATDTAGVKDLMVGATTGAVTMARAFTVLPDDGIATVSPATVPSYATGSAATVALDGAGFGTTGTVKVGAAAAVSYTATAAGTHIASVAVPTGVAGSLPIVVTPTGAKTPLRSSVRVTAPALTYVGPDPHVAVYGPPDIDSGNTGLVLDVPTTGGSAMRIEGSGFGATGTLKFGTTTVTTAAWTDIAITFVAPPHAAGAVVATITPTHSTLSASADPAAQYITPAVGPPTIAKIASVVDHSRNGRNEFDPVNDVSDAFTLTGANLAGTSTAATRVIVGDGTDTFTVVPTSVTPTSLTLAAPRGFTNGGWKDVEVVTNVGANDMNYGLYYLSAGVVMTVSPYAGLCLRTTTPATGQVSYSPAVVTITNSGSLFGASGTVTIDGVAVTPTSYAEGQVVISMANLATDLAQPWGGKTIVVTPTDPNLAVQNVGFTCGVTPSVTTTVNGATDPLTVAAGTAYTLGYTTTGFVGASPFTVTAPGGYEYVSAADFAATGFQSNVHAGAPVGAGDYYVRVALSRATYAAERYLAFTPSAVHLTITGTPITITPVSANGTSFAYKGQLGDGTNGSPADFHYTTTPAADPVTGVTWQYRDSVCESSAPSAGWIDGLPKDVAMSSPGCSGDGVTPSSWDVRVRSFTMNSTGTDRSIYYQPTLPTTQITISPRSLSVAAVRADKVYDGTTTATLGDLTVTGAIAGDDIALANGAGSGTFGDPSPGVDKPVTLSADLTLAGVAQNDYTLANPRPRIVGTITKASAVLSLAASTSSVLLSQNTPVTITPTVADSRTNAPVSLDAAVAPVVLSSQTGSICTVSGTTVTAIAAGSCVIAGTEAASVNYQAATAASDPTSTTETVDIHVFPAPQAISVVADDLTVAVGDAIDPTSEISGLFDGDSIDNIGYAYYSGTTLLNAPPTAPGTYKVVPTGGTLNAATTAVYSNPTAFIYVGGSLIITALPPTITTIAPASGPTTGGTQVTVSGTLLDTVKSVRIGAVTLRVGDFTVNQDGTALVFVTPKVSAPGPVDLVLAAGPASAADVYTYLAPIITVPGPPTQVHTVGHDKTITVTFTPPSATGGAPITAYQFSTDGGLTWHTASTSAGPHGTRAATLTGLANGVTYTVKVRAVNSQGAGAASAADTARPVVTNPGAPTQVHAVGHDERIGVSFLPPASAGGSAIAFYQFSTDRGRTWRRVDTKAGAHGTRTAILTGVKNGVTYWVKVRAVNSQGAGPAPQAVSALPNAPKLGTVRHPAASEVAIPTHPRNYHGPRRFTRALNTSHNGTWAHPIPDLGTRQLTTGEAATLFKGSLFEFDSARLTPAGVAAVKNLAGHLRLAHAVNCEGYTDYAGNAAHQTMLSSQRSRAICQGLVHYGAHVHFTTHGYGGQRPVVIGGTPESRVENRRVVVFVTS